MTSRKNRMEEILRHHFQVIELSIENQSSLHASHYDGDGETHFLVHLVAEEFRTLNRVQRHQKVNELFKMEFEQGLHALSLKLLSPEEWRSRSSS